MLQRIKNCIAIFLFVGGQLLISGCEQDTAPTTDTVAPAEIQPPVVPVSESEEDEPVTEKDGDDEQNEE